MKNWSEINGRYGGNPQVGKYIGIYFAFGIGSALLVVVQTLILWIFCSIEVRLHMHARMCRTEALMYALCRLRVNSTNAWPSPSSDLP